MRAIKIADDEMGLRGRVSTRSKRACKSGKAQDHVKCPFFLLDAAKKVAVEFDTPKTTFSRERKTLRKNHVCFNRGLPDQFQLWVLSSDSPA